MPTPDERQASIWKSHISGPRFTKNLKSDRNRKHISEAKMCFTKYNFMTTSVFERKWLDVVVTIVCWLTMALVVLIQEDVDVFKCVS